MKSDKSETLRKKAEEANSLLTAIVESSDDAIIGKTLDGTILSWNSSAQKIYGYSADEVMGKSISILVPPNNTDEVPRFLERIRQGQRIGHHETVRLRKDGKQIDISLTISPIKDSTGKIIGASTIARDISERKRAEEELRRAHDELEIRVRERTAELEDANIELEAEIAERKQAEKKIEHLASFPQLNPNPVIEIDADGMITFSNAATAEFLKTLEIEDDARIFLPGDFEEIMKAFEQEKETQPFYRQVEVKDRMAHVFLKVLPYENKIPKKFEVIRFWLCANSNMAV